MEKKPYDFQKKLLQIHRRDLYKNKDLDKKQYCILQGDVSIRISPDAGEVIETAAKDFARFLSASMGISATVSIGGFASANNVIDAGLARNHCVDLEKAAVYRGFMINVDEGISLYGHDERGVAQAFYYLEDLMTFSGAPAVLKGSIKRHPMYSPQMVHSGFALDEYPDAYLSKIAHEGRDAILVFTKGVNQTPSGYLDFNDLIRRAARFGIDVYAYSYLISDMSPEADGAEEYYENTYGRLFKECPGLKGVTLVGESVEFPSKDTHIAKGHYYETAVDGIPSDKRSSGWYPCEDYPIWLNLVKKVIRQYNSEADIVFWTYNWGFQPKEARIKLIENLPTDITLQATFEMFENKQVGNQMVHCSDYTLSFAGPGEYFVSEAEAAKKRGIRLYSMTNTGGLTWDFGVIPYEPMPYQWMKRYKGMREAREKWGLCGIMETHHFGLYPSIISKLSKWAFYEETENVEEILFEIVKSEFGTENFEAVISALKSWSEGITHYIPTNADQYGAFRIGPSYPFVLDANVTIPCDEKAMFGNKICINLYLNEADHRDSLLSIRIHEDIKELSNLLKCLESGVSSLETISAPNEQIAELLNLGRFIRNCVKTGIDAKKWYVLKSKLNAETSKEKVSCLLDEMETLLKREIDIAQDTVLLVKKNSRLGWEPSMCYMTDEWHLNWKIKQVNYVLNTEIVKYRKSLEQTK